MAVGCNRWRCSWPVVVIGGGVLGLWQWVVIGGGVVVLWQWIVIGGGVVSLLL